MTFCVSPGRGAVPDPAASGASPVRSSLSSRLASSSQSLLYFARCPSPAPFPMPVEHYENFPVASWLMPKRLRRPVEAIYHFARQADDLADEGDASPAERRAALAAFDAQLVRIAGGQAPAPEPAGPMFERLAAEIHQHRLPMGLFHDLLSAFSQDCVVERYADDAQLLDYCRRSANPVGRLLLVLYGADHEVHRLWSDRICTSLQWINFWQDVAVDRLKNRIYLPLADLERFGVDPQRLMVDPRAVMHGTPFKALMRYEVDRTRAMMLDGAPLALALPGRIGYELRLIVQGGLRILTKIERVDYDVLDHRPTLGRGDVPALVLHALTMRGRGARPLAAGPASAPLQSHDDA